MAHIHDITDSDKRFIIDVKTRAISFLGEHKLKLIQGDHNSERVTFAVPRYIEGHDMLGCSKVEVHFVNISVDKKSLSAEVYPVDDVQVSPDSDDVIIFSWLISGNATRYAGILSFIIKFTCLTGETVDYVWHTDIYSDITVGEGMDNGEAVIAEYSDVLEAWKAEVLDEIEKARAQLLQEIELAADIVQTTGESETAVMSQKATTREVERIDARIDSDRALIESHHARISNLEQRIDPSLFITDSSIAHEKVVSTKACPYAEINKIGGMSYKTRNLIPFPYDNEVGYETEKNGLKFKYLSDGGISVVGTTTTSGTVFPFIAYPTRDMRNICQQGKQYTLSGGTTEIQIAGHITPLDDIKSTAWIETPNKATGTMPEGYGVYRFVLYIASAGVEINTVVYPMLNEGPTALPFEPYFEGLRDTKVTALESRGANLIPFPYNQSNKTSNGITFATSEDGTISINGTSSGNATLYVTNKLPLTQGKTYTITGNKNTANLEDSVYIVLEYYNLDTSKYAGAITVKYGESQTFTVDGNYGYTLNVRVVGTGVVCNNITFRPMLNHGSVAKPYSPFGTIVDTFTISEELRTFLEDKGYGIGKNSTEYNYIDFERKMFKGDYGKVRLPSNVGSYNADSNWYYMPLSVIGIAPKSMAILCNLLPSADVFNNTANYGIDINGAGTHLLIRIKDFASKNDYIQWLANNEVYIVERLITPIEIDISAYLTDDNFIEVEGGGTITAVNEYDQAAPTEITYQLEEVTA